MPQPLFTPGKDPVPIVQEAGWAPGLVWTGAENLAPTGIRSPDRPARSKLLYRLRYPAHDDLSGGFIISCLHITLSGSTEDEKGQVCQRQRSNNISPQNFSCKSLKGTDHMEYTGIAKSIILKWRLWIIFICCEHGNELVESINNRKTYIILVGKQLEKATWRTKKELG